MSDLRRAISNPELKRTSSTSSTESPDLLRQERSRLKKDRGRESQEVVASSSTPGQTDVLRNLASKRRNSHHQQCDQATSRQDFAAALRIELERREQADTIRASHDIPMRSLALRDSSRSQASNEGQSLLSDLDLRRLEEGLRDTVRDTVREELDRRANEQANRPRTWREWFNSDFNSYVSTGGTALGVLTIAGFVYTYRPDLIPHH